MISASRRLAAQAREHARQPLGVLAGSGRVDSSTSLAPHTSVIRSGSSSSARVSCSRSTSTLVAPTHGEVLVARVRARARGRPRPASAARPASSPAVKLSPRAT